MQPEGTMQAKKELESHARRSNTASPLHPQVCFGVPVRPEAFDRPAERAGEGDVWARPANLELLISFELFSFGAWVSGLSGAFAVRLQLGVHVPFCTSGRGAATIRASPDRDKVGCHGRVPDFGQIRFDCLPTADSHRPGIEADVLLQIILGKRCVLSCKETHRAVAQLVFHTSSFSARFAHRSS